MPGVLDRLASALERNDEQPNIALAQELARRGDAAAIRELVAALKTGSAAVQSDAVKVLYEVGALRPALIAPYVNAFLDLLTSRRNRLVWGGMTALGCIAREQADVIWPCIQGVMDATEKGSVITQDWGARVLGAVAASGPARRRRILPFLIDFFGTCPHKDMPKHAEGASGG